jgi:archaea-specific DNA-binding protein
MAVMLVLNKGVACTVKARGRAISHAVDVAEILSKKFFPTARYESITIDTEQLENSDGKISNVSSMEIVILPN